jgi:hypothetical protein
MLNFFSIFSLLLSQLVSELFSSCCLRSDSCLRRPKKTYLPTPLYGHLLITRFRTIFDSLLKKASDERGFFFSNASPLSLPTSNYVIYGREMQGLLLFVAAAATHSTKKYTLECCFVKIPQKGLLFFISYRVPLSFFFV